MAISLVATVSLAPPTNNGGTTAAVDTTGATLLVISAAWYNGFGADVTVSDSKGNTWAGLTKRTSGNGVHRFFYCLAPIVGTGHTFTVPTGSSYAAAVIYAFSGVSSYQTESGNTSSGSTPVATGSVTPSANGALVVTGLAANQAATDAIAPGGFTLTTVPNAGGVHMQTSAAYLVQATAAAIDPTWSWTAGDHTWIAVGTAVFLGTAESETGARLTQLVAETLTAIPASPVRLTQASAEVLATWPVGARLTQAPLETVQQFAAPLVEGRLTQAPLEIIYPFGCYTPPTTFRPPACPIVFPVD